MTPREMRAAAEGWGRAERTRAVTTAQAIGMAFDGFSEREAEAFIEGQAMGRAPSQDEQNEKVKELAERFGEDINIDEMT